VVVVFFLLAEIAFNDAVSNVSSVAGTELGVRRVFTESSFFFFVVAFFLLADIAFREAVSNVSSEAGADDTAFNAKQRMP
jgi:hypothetical protein